MIYVFRCLTNDNVLWTFVISTRSLLRPLANSKQVIQCEECSDVWCFVWGLLLTRLWMSLRLVKGMAAIWRLEMVSGIFQSAHLNLLATRECPAIDGSRHQSTSQIFKSLSCESLRGLNLHIRKGLSATFYGEFMFSDERSWLNVHQYITIHLSPWHSSIHEFDQMKSLWKVEIGKVDILSESPYSLY